MLEWDAPVESYVQKGWYQFVEVGGVELEERTSCFEVEDVGM